MPRAGAFLACLTVLVGCAGVQDVGETLDAAVLDSPDAGAPRPVDQRAYENNCRAVYNIWLVQEWSDECQVLSVDGFPGERIDGAVLYLGPTCPEPGDRLREWATDTSVEVEGTLAYEGPDGLPGVGPPSRIAAQGVARFEDGREIVIDFESPDSVSCCGCWP
jgi:hypothetical protein